MCRYKLNRILGLAGYIIALHWTVFVHAAPGALSDVPLFTSSNVPPNVFFEVDDSGSMDFEVLAKPHWHYCAYDSNGRDAETSAGNSLDCGVYLEAGTGSVSYSNKYYVYTLVYYGNSFYSGGITYYYDYYENGNYFYYYNASAYNADVVYIFEGSDNLYEDDTDGFFSCSNTIQNCTDSGQKVDWRLFSSDLNTVYYNPSVEYEPWQGASFTDADFSSVRSDPQPSSDGYNDRRNLKDGISSGSNTGFIYEVWEDSHKFKDDRPRRGSNKNKAKGPNGIVDLWDKHTRYYVKGNEIIEKKIKYRFKDDVLKEKVESTTTYSGTDTLNGRTVAEVQQNIANWYQYHRRRSFVAKAALGNVITENPENRYGLNFINNSQFPYDNGTKTFVNVPTGISGFSSHNNSLLQDFYGLNWRAIGTPLRQGLERVGQYFDNNSSANDPIQYECQQNFAVLLTDGYWNGSDPAVGNADGDSYSNTVADVAKYYYDKDLSNKADEVPVSSLDPVTKQHLVTFTVAFGVNGLLTDMDNNGWPEDPSDSSKNLAENGNWGDPVTEDNDRQKIDDLWHAAYNSKGTFVSASTPTEVSKALSSAIGSIGDRQGSNAAVAFNSSTLSSDTNLFLAQFNKKGNKWSGDLVSYDLDSSTGSIAKEVDPNDPNAKIKKVNWKANDELNKLVNPASSRTIITYDSDTGSGIPFQWGDLSDVVKNDFRTEPNNTLSSDNVKAEARLNYLRGDRRNEVLKHGTYSFRNRENLLGDIIHSAPAFVKKPIESWPNSAPFSPSGNNYASFKTAQASREGVVYVGSNDGMLHGFSEATGTELMAYIPSFLFSSSATEGLHFLTDPAYQHRYYVDLAPSVSDVYIDKGTGSDWHSVLIGGSRSGGRGLFALDVTNPSHFSEANASNMVLWEFTDKDDADLGFTFSAPTIAMLNNNRWAAIFGNGYNNKGDGKAKLFIVYLDGGGDGLWTPTTDYIEIDTDVGSIVNSDCLDSASDCNGLSSPEAVDVDGDLIVDRIYAGDIKGNLWAFDVSNSSATNWKVAYEDGGVPKPLFIASSGQPITDKPISVKHPDIEDTISPSNAPNRLVFFGTGQYLTESDVKNIPATQSFYGVWDHGKKEINPSDLFEQNFDTSTTFFDNNECEEKLTDGTCVDTENNVTNSIRVFNNDVNGDGTIDPDDPKETIDYKAIIGSTVSHIHHGWKINFDLIAGERIVVDPIIHDGLVLFNTIVPDSSICKAGGVSYLMSVEQSNGGAPDINDPAFDLNGDGKIDSNDLVKDSSDSSKKSAAVGQKFDLGLAAGSKVIGNGNVSKQYTPGSDGGTGDRTIRGGTSPGRISWQELR